MNAVSEAQTTLTGYPRSPRTLTIPVTWPSGAVRQDIVNCWGPREMEGTRTTHRGG